MEREGLGAFIFPSTDAHNGEYVADHWDGPRVDSQASTRSAGTVVVTMDAAALWTDSRYFLAAEEQTPRHGYHADETQGGGARQTITDWLAEQLRGTSRPCCRRVLDGWVNGTDEVQRMPGLLPGLRYPGAYRFRPAQRDLDGPSLHPDSEGGAPSPEFAGETTESKFAASVSRCAVVMPRPCSSQPSTILPGL